MPGHSMTSASTGDRPSREHDVEVLHARSGGSLAQVVELRDQGTRTKLEGHARIRRDSTGAEGVQISGDSGVLIDGTLIL